MPAAIGLGQATSRVVDGRWVPWPVIVQALVFGGLYATTALALILVYRASRIINFAQVAFGGVGATLFFLLSELEHWSWYAAAGAGLAAAVALGVLTEVLLLRRFAKAPRLVLTVATLGVAQVLLYMQTKGLRLAFDLGTEEVVQGRPPSPLTRHRFHWNPTTFNGDHVLVALVTIAAVAGLWAFMRYTNVGIAIRGAASNDDRASLLGVNTRNLQTLIWGLTALLSVLPAIALIPITGAASADNVSAGAAGGAIGPGLLLRALAAGVLARMESLPVAAAAALGIAAFEQSVFWAVGQSSVVDAVMLGVIVVALFVQRSSLGRSESTEFGSWAATEEARPVPPELTSVESVRRARRLLVGALAIAALAFPWVMSPSQTNRGSIFVIFGIVAASLVILTGWGGQVSLGQFAFVAVGAAVGGAVTAKLGWHFLIAVPIAGIVGAVVAIVVGLPALRLVRGLFLAVTTLGFAIVTATVVLNERFFGWLLPDSVERPKFFFVDTEDERAFFYMSVVFLALAVAAVSSLRRTRTGRALIAMRDNEQAAQSFGLNLAAVRLQTFAISGFLAAVAGVLFAHHQHDVSARSFGPEESIAMFLMAVIGGLGSVAGALLGAVYVGVTTIFGSPAIRVIATGAGVLVVLLFFPGGLGSVAYRLRDAWLRRVAIRNRIFAPSLVPDRRLVESARVQLAPKFGDDGEVATVPVRYRITSRIRTAGASQRERGWRF